MPDGRLAQPHELGRLVVKLPLPPGNMSTLYKNDTLFKKTYFEKYPVSTYIISMNYNFDLTYIYTLILYLGIL